MKGSDSDALTEAASRPSAVEVCEAPVRPASSVAPGAAAARLASLDQFRGYTMAGMVLVNFLGGFAVIHPLLKHHNTFCSYADTIMPQFFFAVGFAYRLTFRRRLASAGPRLAYRRIARRVVGLLLIGAVIYHLDARYLPWNALRSGKMGALLEGSLKRDFFQTLTHIALATLWVTPVMARRSRVLALFGVGSALLHVLLSHWFNFAWVWSAPRSIDGGPLGFLTWTVPLIAGALACDLVRAGRGWRLVRRLAVWAVVLMAAGYALSSPSALYDGAPTDASGRLAASPVLPPVAPLAEGGAASLLVEPPFVAPPRARPTSYWTMSQRSGALSYQTFGAGFSLAVFALFVVLADLLGIRFGLFRALGRNSLIAYLLDGFVGAAASPFAPKTASLGHALLAFAAVLTIIWACVRVLEWRGIRIRI